MIVYATCKIHGNLKQTEAFLDVWTNSENQINANLYCLKCLREKTNLLPKMSLNFKPDNTSNYILNHNTDHIHND